MHKKRTDAVALRQMQATLRKGEKLSDEQVLLLAGLHREGNLGKMMVGVAKVDLRDGEEMMDFVWTMMSAVQTDRIILADGSLDARLVGIFNDHVIVEDGNTGRLFRATFSRTEKGEIVFETPIEVRQVFVPVESSSEDGGEEIAAAVKKSATPAFDEILEVTKRLDGRKWGFLPTSMTRR